MKFSKFFVLVALLGLSANDQESSVQAIKIAEGSRVSDFNGADEDDIMDKVFSKYSSEGKDHNGVKNGRKILLKQTAPKAAGVILEATHKLKGSQVPGYIKANFDKAWDKFDINADGYIKAEETHTFMRSLMGKLNKFALAPGSLSDIGAGGASVSSDMSSLVEKVAPKRVHKAAPKPVEVTETTDTSADTPAPDASAADSSSQSDDPTAMEQAALELDQILP